MRQWSCALAICLGVVAGMTTTQEARAQANHVDGYCAQEFTSSIGTKLVYRLLQPESVTAGKKYPLVIFLHGAGERGNDNEAQLRHVAKELSTPEMRERYPAFVIAPQCPKENRWVEVDWALDSHVMPEKPSIPLAALMELIEQSKTELPVDPDRIYVMGLSMGGFGTWDLLQRQPQAFAAGVPICGGADEKAVRAARGVPVWTFHGDKDTVVKTSRSQNAVAALRSANGKVIYTEYPGVSHDSWTATGKNRLVWDWLFAQKRTLSSPANKK